MSSAEQSVTIRYENSGPYTVSLVVKDVFGKDSEPATKDLVLTTKPRATLSNVSCFKQQCTFNAEDSIVYAPGTATYTYSFPGTTLPDIVRDDADEIVTVLYNGKQDPNDTNAYFTDSSQDFNIELELVDGAGKKDTDIKQVTITAQYLDVPTMNDITFSEFGQISAGLVFTEANDFVYDSNTYHINVFQNSDNPDESMWDTPTDWGNINFQTKVNGTTTKNTLPASSAELLYSKPYENRELVVTDFGWYGICISGPGFSRNCGYFKVDQKPSFDIASRVQYQESADGNTYFGIDIYNLSKLGAVNYLKLVYKQAGKDDIVIYDKTGTPADYGNSTELTGKIASAFPDYSSLKPVAVVASSTAGIGDLCLTLGTESGISDETCVHVQPDTKGILPKLGFDIVNITGFWNGGIESKLNITIDPGKSMTAGYWHLKEHSMVVSVPNSSFEELWSYANIYDNGTIYRAKVLSDVFGYNKQTGVNNTKKFEVPLMVGTYRVKSNGYNTQGQQINYIDIHVTSTNPFEFTMDDIVQENNAGV